MDTRLSETQAVIAQTISPRVSPPQPPVVEQEKSNNSKPVFIIICILVLFATVIVSESSSVLPILKTSPQPTSNNAQPTQNITQPSPAAQIDATAGWKTYTNAKYNYTLKYPPEWEVSTCAYADNESGVVRNLIPEQLNDVEFHELGWDCPNTDSFLPYFGIYIKDDKPSDPQFFPPIYGGTDRAIEHKPDKQIGEKLFFVYWIVKKEPSPLPDNEIMYFLKNNGKIYSFQIYENNELTIEKILSTFQFH